MNRYRGTPAPGVAWLIVCVFLLIGSGAVRSQEVPPAGATLIVAVKPLMPFVIVDPELRDADLDAALSGFSIDLWRSLAIELNVTTEWLLLDSVQDVLDAVAAGQADVGIAGISITSEREAVLDFTLPIFNAGLDILSREDTGLSLGDLVTILLSSQVTQIVLIMAVVIFIAGNVVWLIERHNNPDFYRAYHKGLFEGIWWAAVTVATVGYGDKTPKSVLGRVIAILWMFIGIALVAQFTAVITSGITLAGIRGAIDDLGDLYGRQVGTVAGTTAEAFLRDIRIQPLTYAAFEAAASDLLAERIDAIVYDQPVLMYYAMREGRGRVRVSNQLFVQEYYGIAVQAGSPWRERINQALLRNDEAGSYDAIYERWFGDD